MTPSRNPRSQAIFGALATPDPRLLFSAELDLCPASDNQDARDTIDGRALIERAGLLVAPKVVRLHAQELAIGIVAALQRQP